MSVVEVALTLAFMDTCITLLLARLGDYIDFYFYELMQDYGLH
jgi:hypothetical protein